MDRDTFAKIAGGFGGGFAGVITSHPIDTVKCRIQSQGSVGLAERYRSGRHAIADIIKNEGFRGLYKGVLPPFWMQGVMNGVIFGVERNLAKHWIKEGDENSTTKHFLAAMTAGFVQSFICAPMELVKLKTQHQAIGQSSGYQGNLATFRDICRKGGVRGCYQGLSITMVRDVPAFGVYFATYEGLMTYTAKKQNEIRDEVSYYTRFLFGGVAGVASWVGNYPVDLVKTRIQLDGRAWNAAERQYKNSWDCFVKAWKEGGLRLLYRGFSPCMARAFLFSMVTFPTADFVEDCAKKAF